MAAQFNGLLPSGNVYGGVSYGQLTDVINQQSYRGWNASFEDIPFTRFPRLGLVVDGSGFYRPTACGNTTLSAAPASPPTWVRSDPSFMPWPAFVTFAPPTLLSITLW